MSREETIRKFGSRAPGEDPEDPYADISESELPGWWRRAKREFEEHGFRPYRPPRFEDEALKYELVEELERTLDVELSFTNIDSEHAQKWEIRLDGRIIGYVGRFRSPKGYTVYQIESEKFTELVKSAESDGGCSRP